MYVNLWHLKMVPLVLFLAFSIIGRGRGVWKTSEKPEETNIVRFLHNVVNTLDLT